MPLREQTGRAWDGAERPLASDESTKTAQQTEAALQQTGWGSWMSAHGEMNVDADLTPSTRSNQKETTNLQAKRTATELLYDTVRVNLGELRLGF